MSRQVIEDTIHQHLRHHLPRLRLGKKSLFCGFSHSHMYVNASFHHLVQVSKSKGLVGLQGKGCLEGCERVFEKGGTYVPIPRDPTTTTYLGKQPGAAVAPIQSMFPHSVVTKN